MTLRTRLVLISLLVLSLPLAGWQLVRSMEHSLRDSYQQALIDSARATASRLAVEAEQQWPATGGFYVHPARHELVIDGHPGEWDQWLEHAQDQDGAAAGSSPVAIVAAERRGRLYLLLEVTDSALVLADQYAGPGDHLLLRLTEGERSGQVRIAPAAPGWLESGGEQGWPRVQAAMQPSDRGWTMEIAVMSPLQPDRIALEVVRVDSDEDRRTTVMDASKESRRLIRPSERLSGLLGNLLHEQTRGWITGPGGWVLAHADRQRQPDTEETQTGGRRLATSLAAQLLGVWPQTQSERGADSVRLSAPEMTDLPAAAWHQSASGAELVVTAAVPITLEDRWIGNLVIERRADRFMTNAYRSVLQLFMFGLGGMLAIALVLIGFAARLSARIQRLRDAAESAVSQDGRVLAPLSPPRGTDEVADLGRSLAGMIERQRDHQEHLQALASRLSHELRTPLALLRSSLDNLAEVESRQDRERYRLRAEEGCRRLQHMFQAMSQAARIEQSLADDPLVELDLGEMVDAYAEGCRQTHADRRFAAVVPDRGRAVVRASAEQLAQLLDKLVENAVDFSPPESRITLRVVPQGRWISLQVDNPGSRLPRDLEARMFDSMVSSRSSDHGGAHLGLGLHVARLIARRHGARIRAVNRRDGVRFQVDIPRPGRRPAQELR